MPSTLYLSANRYLAFGFESSWGSAAAPSVYLQVDSNPGTKPQVTYLANKALYGSPALQYGDITGVQHTELTVKGNLFTDTGPQLLYLAFGTDTVSGTAAPYTHSIKLLNDPSVGSQPPSITVVDVDNILVSAPAGNAKQVVGCLFDKLSVSIAATGAVTWNGTLVGSEITETTAPSTIAFSTAVFPPAWSTAFTLNGAAYPYVEQLDFDITLGAKPVPTLFASAAPYVIFREGMTVTGKLTIAVPPDDPVYYSALQTTSNVLAAKVTDPVSGDTITFTFSNVQFKAPAVASDKPWETIPVSFDANANVTDALSGYAPMQVAVTNGVSTAYGA